MQENSQKYKPTSVGRIALERQAGRKTFNRIYINSKYNENNRDHSKMKSERVKKSLEKSKNVLEEKRKRSSNTFTTNAMNFVQKQLNTAEYFKQNKNITDLT